MRLKLFFSLCVEDDITITTEKNVMVDDGKQW